MTAFHMSPLAVDIAESLRSGPMGLSGVVSLAPSPASMARELARVRRVVRRRGVAGTVRRAASGPGVRPTTTAEWALRHGIEHWCVPSANHADTADVLRCSGLDHVAAFECGILRPVVLDVGGVVFVNAHPGKVPEYRGSHPALWAAYHRHPIVGTVHRMDAGIDTGDMLLEQPLDFGRPADVYELSRVTLAATWALVPAALGALARGEAAFGPQPGGGTQWFHIHRVLLKVAQSRLDDGSFYEVQERALSDKHGR